MDFVRINQHDGILIFEKFKHKELLLISSGNDVYQIYVNVDGTQLTEEEKARLSEKYQIEINSYLSYGSCRLEFHDFQLKTLHDLTAHEITIPKGWADESKMAGIYVGWGIETFTNKVKFTYLNEVTIGLEWTCTSDDLNRYDHLAQPADCEVRAELNVIWFKDKAEYWAYEKRKLPAHLQ